MMVDEQLEDIAYLFTIGIAPEGYIVTHKKQLVIKARDCQLIARHLYKLGADEILCKCILQHEREAIMKDLHEGQVGVHYACKATTHKIIHTILWC